MLVGIQDEILRLHSMGLLKQLLVDKTTRTNIIWATDAYQEQGAEYQRDKEIKEPLITGQNSDVIKTRARKAMEQQSDRTRKHAEVFTPLWICQKMVRYADDSWFGKTGAFSSSDEQSKEYISFSSTHKWQDYVDARRLEITCGEAPYLVNRYDVSTGESILLENREGILDRKLQVVNENVYDEAEWLKWVIRAFQSTYGYEFQGDNVLIARVNLLMTFEEHLYARWKRKPFVAEYREIVKIIAWNIWQMDGLSGTIPYCKAEEEFHQFNLFEWIANEEYQEKVNEQPHCRIYDWRRGNSLQYTNVNKGGRKMKFDFVIGNPPYQEETEGAGRQAKPLYNLFVEQIKKLDPQGISLIIPSRWFAGGMGLDSFRIAMMAEKKLKYLVDYVNAKECFPNSSISGGVCYFLWDRDYCGDCSFTNVNGKNVTTMQRPLDEFPVLVRYNEAVKIIHKIRQFKFNSMETIISPLMPFGLNTNYRGISKRNNNAQLILHASNGITYIDASEIQKGQEYISKYKVLISKTGAEHAGEPDKSGMFRVFTSSIKVIGPNEVCTHSYFMIGVYDTVEEANNTLKYLKTKFVRFLVLLAMSSINLSKQVFPFVPLQDFTFASDIDWNKAITKIDIQLYAKYNLDEIEINFIESHIKEMV